MAHTIISLHLDRFDTRATLGGCTLNVGGETFDCLLDRDNANRTSPTYTARSKDSGQELCTFRPFHLEGGPIWYQVKGASSSGGDATLLVPSMGMLKSEEDEDEDDLAA